MARRFKSSDGDKSSGSPTFISDFFQSKSSGEPSLRNRQTSHIAKDLAEHGNPSTNKKTFQQSTMETFGTNSVPENGSESSALVDVAVEKSLPINGQHASGPSTKNSYRHEPKDPLVWKRFKNLLLVIAYILGKKIEVSKTNLVKVSLFAYINKRLFMYVPKNLGMAGVVPRDLMNAIKELVQEGKLEDQKKIRIMKHRKMNGDIQNSKTTIHKFIVPPLIDVKEIYSELSLSNEITFERYEDELAKAYYSINTKAQGRHSVDCIISRIEKETSLDRYIYHKYVTFWDAERKWKLIGLGIIKMGEIFGSPFPEIALINKDPIKRDKRLILDLLRQKGILDPATFWISSAIKEFDNSKEKTLGRVCLFFGFLCSRLRYDSISKTFMTTLTESAYCDDSRNQIKLILDADNKSAYYFTTEEDLYNYEYAAIGSLTEYNGRVALRCYGLIEIDTLPDEIKRIWKDNFNN